MVRKVGSSDSPHSSISNMDPHTIIQGILSTGRSRILMVLYAIYCMLFIVCYLLFVIYCLLCSQLLDQLQNELLKCSSEVIIKINNPWTDTVLARDLLKSLFEGQLISTVS